ncbi:PREDICTED: pentatricopeptide repeat-containing protein At1g77405 [Ipomoea nil]|uniref:pentatricopeptide repeat-containing protein At1g77405 n=1 Tax=Ipomoea nil TaxID=35883 RepID=UPI0009018223|nr:PREDICTED: pentatricopeptide repeat-containing protein At1g77405 [Ipomoea nil]
MFLSRPLYRSFSQSAVADQILAAIIQNRPFDAIAPASTTRPVWSVETVSEVLRSIPRFLFQSPRSIGRQDGFRHRSPLKQRNLRQESDKALHGKLVLGPAAYRDPEKVQLGLDKALEFFDWVETSCGFTHNDLTCREMGVVLAKGGGGLKLLLDFLKKMSKRGLVTTPTITCLIKVLGEEGLANEALFTFYRMKQFHCRPDVHAYNTVIYALCRVGNFKKAKFLLEQMELPGFRCPPDAFTYTVLISSFCRYAMQTGCRKAIRRRMWEANHFFRLMLFKGFVPDVVTYNSLINGCCKTYRIGRALELLEDMEKRGCAPNRVTYNSFIRYYSAVNETDKAMEMMRRMQEGNHGVATNSSFTPVIHALCEAGRAVEAWDLLVELVQGGSIPREYTYALVCKALETAGEMQLLDGRLCSRVEEGIQCRIGQAKKLKPLFSRKDVL